MTNHKNRNPVISISKKIHKTCTTYTVKGFFYDEPGLRDQSMGSYDTKAEAKLQREHIIKMLSEAGVKFGTSRAGRSRSVDPATRLAEVIEKVNARAVRLLND